MVSYLRKTCRPLLIVDKSLCLLFISVILSKVKPFMEILPPLQPVGYQQPAAPLSPPFRGHPAPGWLSWLRCRRSGISKFVQCVVSFSGLHQSGCLTPCVDRTWIKKRLINSITGRVMVSHRDFFRVFLNQNGKTESGLESLLFHQGKSYNSRSEPNSFHRQFRSGSPLCPTGVIPLDAGVTQEMDENKVCLACLMPGTAMNNHRCVIGRNNTRIGSSKFTK